MKILKEAKENLPIEFITSFISRGWEEVGNTKESLKAIEKEFKNTKDVVDAIQDFVDAYLICIGRLESHLGDKKYIEFPTESADESEGKVVAESLKESAPAVVRPAPSVKQSVSEDDFRNSILAELEEADATPAPAPKAATVTQKPVTEEPAPKAAVEDDWEFAADFDDIVPSALPLTDEDIYDENGKLKI